MKRSLKMSYFPAPVFVVYVATNEFSLQVDRHSPALFHMNGKNISVFSGTDLKRAKKTLYFGKVMQQQKKKGYQHVFQSGISLVLSPRHYSFFKIDTVPNGYIGKHIINC